MPASGDSELDLDLMRAQLEQRREEMRDRVGKLAARPERGAAQGFGKRIGDGTVEAISRLTDIGVGTSLESALARTERALAKLDDGTYGRCDVCGDAILSARLHAMPDAVLCMTCTSAQRRTAPPPRR